MVALALMSAFHALERRHCLCDGDLGKALPQGMNAQAWGAGQRDYKRTSSLPSRDCSSVAQNRRSAGRPDKCFHEASAGDSSGGIDRGESACSAGSEILSNLLNLFVPEF